MKKSESLFIKYEHIAKNYAQSLHQVEVIGYEKDDVFQEFRIKLYQTILSYLRGESLTPIEIYLKSAMSNFKNDFLQKMRKSNEVFCYNTMVESCDYAVSHQECTIIDTDENKFIISGIDITSPLKGKHRAAFVMHLKGSSIDEVKRVYVRHVPDIEKIIQNHKRYLKSQRHQLQPENSVEYFVSNYQEQD